MPHPSLANAICRFTSVTIVLFGFVRFGGNELRAAIILSAFFFFFFLEAVLWEGRGLMVYISFFAHCC
jgi:hypothetical protein